MGKALVTGKEKFKNHIDRIFVTGVSARRALGRKKSDLFFEDKETAEFINLMAENHYLKERKKAKKERKPVGQPVGAKVQGWPTNPKNKNVEQVR